jgi:hypothetical protein
METSMTSPDAMPAWILMRDRVPERDGFYLVASSEPFPPSVYVLEFRNADSEAHFYWRAEGEWRGYVTHWMPLPPPPLSPPKAGE